MVFQRWKGLRTAGLAACALALMGAGAPQKPASVAPPLVLAAAYDGMISPVTARYFQRVLRQAGEERAACVVFEVDTPGGMMDPMREIVQAVLASPIPVALYVYPQGARAASAGTYIAMACDVVAMAPNTNIGAAHPVLSNGEAASEKITNDAAASIRSLALQKGRNADWAEKAVRQSVSAGEQEALRLGVADLVAKDEADLLRQMNGRLIKKTGARLALAGARVEHAEPGWVERFLMSLADPTLAYVLFLVGLSALIFEVTHPGVTLPGVAGIICLILAFISFGSLPVHYGALALLTFGVLLLVAESVVSFAHGVLAAGGLTALVLGSLLLYDTNQAHVAYSVVILVCGVVALFFLLIIARAVKALRRPAMRDELPLVGAEGTALTPLNPEGTVRVQGEEWSAVAEQGAIPAKSQVVVVHADGLRLKVRRLP